MPTTFASVKLPGSLVDEARLAAQPLRRSVASQIEYWATLGRVVEHSGLTVQEAQSAIAAYESGTVQQPAGASERTVADLSQRIRAASAKGGTLAANLQQVIAKNRAGRNA